MAGFVKAQRQRVHIKLAVTGPSGSGKTYSALRLAFGLAGKAGRVAFVDTENGSGSLYADLGDYDVMEITAPFTAQKYIAAINDAVAAGYETLIIDSLSHVWAGDGGLLDQKSARDARGGNSFSNWADVTKLHEQLKSALLQSPIHLIATMRSKQDYVLEQGQNGKQTPRKVGLAPIQRDGMEYEFTTVFDVDMSHTAATSKDRTGLFTDEVSQITEQHGQRLKGWLAGGAAQVPAPPPHESRREPSGTQGAAPPARQEEPARSPARQSSPSPSAAPTDRAACTSCGKELTTAQVTLSQRNYGDTLCPVCQRRQQKPTPAATNAADDDPFADDDIDALLDIPPGAGPGHGD